MLVMVVFFIAFRWIHLSTPLIRLFLLVLILLLMPTLNFLPVWFALSLLRFRLPSRLPMMFILWRSEERFSRNAETDFVCRLLLEKKNHLASKARDHNTRTPSRARDPVYYVGATPGRDRIHGATIAPAEFHEQLDENRPPRQVVDR